MARPIISKRKADAVANGAFFIGLGILLYTNMWWPWILIAVWIFLSLRQFLTGRHWDFILSTVLLIGLFLISYFHIDWSLLAPILFVVGGLYIMFKEFFYADDASDEEKVKGNKNDSDDARDN